MSLRKLFKNRGMAVNMLAGFAFLALAVYGWGLTWDDLLGYLLISLVCLLLVVGLATLAGFLLRKLAERRDRDN